MTPEVARHGAAGYTKSELAKTLDSARLSQKFAAKGEKRRASCRRLVSSNFYSHLCRFTCSLLRLLLIIQFLLAAALIPIRVSSASLIWTSRLLTNRAGELFSILFSALLHKEGLLFVSSQGRSLFFSQFFVLSLVTTHLKDPFAA